MPGPTVAVLAYPGMSAFETGIVTEVFGLPRPELDVAWYRLLVCAERPGPIPVVGGAALHTPYGLADFAAAGTVIVPGVPDVHADPSPELVAALRRAHARGARLVSICSGAFALAGAGLLDGRPATTHWRYAALLRRRYPLVKVDPDVLYVDDGDVLTSAGSAAGLDLAVHLVRRDFGPTVANAVARRLVIPPHRDGGQAQFIAAPVPHDPDDDRVARSMAWAVAHLSPWPRWPGSRTCRPARTCATSPGAAAPARSAGWSRNGSRRACRCWKPAPCPSRRWARGSVSRTRPRSGTTSPARCAPHRRRTGGRSGVARPGTGSRRARCAR